MTVKIVTHPQEKRTKCTGVQAVLLAPEDAELVDFSDVEKEASLPAGAAAVLFPSEDALTPEQVDFSKIDTLYIVDRSVRLIKYSQLVPVL